MSYNETYWNLPSEATKKPNITMQAGSAPAHPDWLEEVIGSVMTALIIIAVVIGVIKNPEAALRLLRRVRDFITSAIDMIREFRQAAPPPLPPREGVPRNRTDDSLIEMQGRQNERIYDAPVSVYI